MVAPGEYPSVPQFQISKGWLIITAALELSKNQVTHFYSKKKNTVEMIKLLEFLLKKYSGCRKLYLSWDAASWHSSNRLVEWISDFETPVAEFIHLILYSREQMAKEDDPVEADWAIVSIATSSNVEVEPMRPITSMRNALGVEEGGSGVVIDRDAYRDSARYWSENIMIRL